MTKEQFLSGAPFYIGKKSYKGDSTYYYHSNANCISRQSRSSVDERVVLDGYECTITKIGRVGFAGMTYVLGKKVVVKYKFDDLLMFENNL